MSLCLECVQMVTHSFTLNNGLDFSLFFIKLSICYQMLSWNIQKLFNDTYLSFWSLKSHNPLQLWTQIGLKKGQWFWFQRTKQAFGGLSDISVNKQWLCIYISINAFFAEKYKLCTYWRFSCKWSYSQQVLKSNRKTKWQNVLQWCRNKRCVNS